MSALDAGTGSDGSAAPPTVGRVAAEEVEQFRKQLEELSASHERCSVLQLELLSVQRERDTATAAREQLRITCLALRREVSNRTTETERLRTMVGAQRLTETSARREARRSGESVTFLKQRLERLREENVSLRKQLTHSKQISEDSDTAQQHLNDRLAEAEAQSERLRQELAATVAERDVLRCRAEGLEVPVLIKQEEEADREEEEEEIPMRLSEPVSLHLQTWQNLAGTSSSSELLQYGEVTIKCEPQDPDEVAMQPLSPAPCAPASVSEQDMEVLRRQLASERKAAAQMKALLEKFHQQTAAGACPKCTVLTSNLSTLQELLATKHNDMQKVRAREEQLLSQQQQLVKERNGLQLEVAALKRDLDKERYAVQRLELQLHQQSSAKTGSPSKDMPATEPVKAKRMDATAQLRNCSARRTIQALRLQISKYKESGDGTSKLRDVIKKTKARLAVQEQKLESRNLTVRKLMSRLVMEREQLRLLTELLRARAEEYRDLVQGYVNTKEVLLVNAEMQTRLTLTAVKVDPEMKEDIKKAGNFLEGELVACRTELLRREEELTALQERLKFGLGEKDEQLQNLSHSRAVLKRENGDLREQVLKLKQLLTSGSPEEIKRKLDDMLAVQSQLQNLNQSRADLKRDNTRLRGEVVVLQDRLFKAGLCTQGAPAMQAGSVLVVPSAPGKEPAVSLGGQPVANPAARSVGPMSEHDRLRSEMAAAQERLKSLSGPCRRCDDKRKRMHEMVAELNSLRGQVGVLKAEVERVRQRGEQWRVQANSVLQAEAQAKGLRDQLAVFEAELNKGRQLLEAANKRNRELEGRTDTLTKMVDNTSAERAELQISQTELQEARRELKEARRDLQNCKHKVEKLGEEAAVAAKQLAEVTATKEQLDTCRSELTVAQQQVETMQKELTELKRRADSRRKELSKLRDMLKTADSQVAKRRKEVQAIRERLKTEVAAMEQRVREEARQTEETLREEARRAQEEIREGAREMEERLRKELRELEDRLEKLELEASELREAVVSERAKNAKLQQTIEGLECDLLLTKSRLQRFNPGRLDENGDLSDVSSNPMCTSPVPPPAPRISGREVFSHSPPQMRDSVPGTPSSRFQEVLVSPKHSSQPQARKQAPGTPHNLLSPGPPCDDLAAQTEPVSPGPYRTPCASPGPERGSDLSQPPPLPPELTNLLQRQDSDDPPTRTYPASSAVSPGQGGRGVAGSGQMVQQLVYPAAGVQGQYHIPIQWYTTENGTFPVYSQQLYYTQQQQQRQQQQSGSQTQTQVLIPTQAYSGALQPNSAQPQVFIPFANTQQVQQSGAQQQVFIPFGGTQVGVASASGNYVSLGTVPPPPPPSHR